MASLGQIKLTHCTLEDDATKLLPMSPYDVVSPHYIDVMKSDQNESLVVYHF